jgi:hypothetical protein
MNEVIIRDAANAFFQKNCTIDPGFHTGFRTGALWFERRMARLKKRIKHEDWCKLRYTGSCLGEDKCTICKKSWKAALKREKRK